MLGAGKLRSGLEESNHARSWLIASVCIEDTRARSSTISLRCGKSSLEPDAIHRAGRARRVLSATGASSPARHAGEALPLRIRSGGFSARASARRGL